VTAQQRPLLDAELRAAAAGASGSARTLLDTIVAWDGNYDRTDADGLVDPGVAAFEALKAETVRRELPRAAARWLGGRGGSHPFDFGAAEAAAMRSVDAAGLRAAAAAAVNALGSADPSAWRRPRLLYDVEVQGVAEKPRLEFFDRGTWQQAVELGP
jgi:hypothetical protein